MISYIPPEITIGSFSLIGVLTAYIWNNQAKRIKRLEKKQEECPLPNVFVSIAEIKNDIKWIKDQIIKLI